MVYWGLFGRCPQKTTASCIVRLKSVDIKVSVRGFTARINASLTYQNDTEDPLEVEYQMPVDEGAAVYRFEAIVDGRKISAQCMEKKKAEKVYKEAVQSGHTAVLAREDDLLSDIFHMALGNLPPGTKAELQLSMIMELKVKTDGAVNFILPTVLNPRYCPVNVTPDQHTKSVAQNLWHDTIVVSEAYTFGIEAKVQGGHAIARILSHTDPLNVKISNDNMSAEITQDGGAFKPDHDWNMLLYYMNPYKTHVIRETGDRSSTGLMKDDLVMINLHPELSEQSYSNKNEIIFVVDRSGSMQGEKMQSARATLLLFLKSLPAGCYFNIISFGSHHSLLFPGGSEKYSEETLARACGLQQSMRADMGGTEIFQPLQRIYSKPPFAGYARQIILLSDGEVFNVDIVKDLVRRNAHETRVFTVGIGHGASTALINGLAMAGRGRSEMVYQQDKLQMKVMGLVRSMLQDTVQDVKVNFTVDPPGGIKLVPKVPPVIYGGQHLVLYARVPQDRNVKGIAITGVIGDTVFESGVAGSDIVTVHDEEMTLHRLAARAQINEWQIDNEEDVGEDMIALSISSGVVSRRTALVGVDQDMKPLDNNFTSIVPEQMTLQCGGLWPTPRSASQQMFMQYRGPRRHPPVAMSFGGVMKMSAFNAGPFGFSSAPQPAGNVQVTGGGLFGATSSPSSGMQSFSQSSSLFGVSSGFGLSSVSPQASPSSACFGARQTGFSFGSGQSSSSVPQTNNGFGASQQGFSFGFGQASSSVPQSNNGFGASQPGFSFGFGQASSSVPQSNNRFDTSQSDFKFGSGQSSSSVPQSNNGFGAGQPGFKFGSGQSSSSVPQSNNGFGASHPGFKFGSGQSSSSVPQSNNGFGASQPGFKFGSGQSSSGVPQSNNGFGASQPGFKFGSGQSSSSAPQANNCFSSSHSGFGFASAQINPGFPQTKESLSISQPGNQCEVSQNSSSVFQTSQPAFKFGGSQTSSSNLCSEVPQATFSFGSSTAISRTSKPSFSFGHSQETEVDLEETRPTKQEESSLMQVVSLQKFNGSWTLVDAAQLTSIPVSRLSEASTAKNEDSWATALILCLLEMKHSEEEDQWMLLANKAKMFITGCGDDVKALMASAKTLLSSV